MKRSLAVLIAGLVLASCVDRGSPGESRRFLSIGTAGTGGIYYPLGGALAGALSVRDPTRQYTAEVTGGSVENVNRIREGQIDLAFAIAVTVYQAYHGEGDYASAPVADLRVVAPLYPNQTHVLVPAGSDATSLFDVRGGRVSVGSAGSGTEQLSRQLLAAYGLDYDDVEERFLTFTETASALRDGAVDAAIISVGYPAAAVLEATATGGVRLLSIGPEQVAAMVERYPYYLPDTIPAGAYPGVERPVPTVALMNWVIAAESLDDATVAAVLKLLEEDKDELVRVHDMARRIDLSLLSRSPIPLHSAVEAWFEGR